MAAAPRYNRWMYERLRPWVGRRVLEIGAGIGNMSAFLIDRDRVVLTDTEPYISGAFPAGFATNRPLTLTSPALPPLTPGPAPNGRDPGSGLTFPNIIGWKDQTPDF